MTRLWGVSTDYRSIFARSVVSRHDRSTVFTPRSHWIDADGRTLFYHVRIRLLSSRSTARGAARNSRPLIALPATRLSRAGPRRRSPEKNGQRTGREREVCRGSRPVGNGSVWEGGRSRNLPRLMSRSMACRDRGDVAPKLINRRSGSGPMSFPSRTCVRFAPV